MHHIEPYFNWRNLYTADQDERSPFYGRINSEVYFTDAIYDHYIHPQWDNIGSTTLFVKLLYADYDDGFAVLELMGEWNDTLHNDVRILKREVIDPLLQEGIAKFILIGDNVLNFHPSDDSYYEEWYEDVEEGWIAGLNFRSHVLQDMAMTGIDQYLIFGGRLNDIDWGTFRPLQLFQTIDEAITRRFDSNFLIESGEEDE
jgi:hypothetical protein